MFAYVFSALCVCLAVLSPYCFAQQYAGESATSSVADASSTASRTSASSIATSYCPSADGQVITDTNGLNYTVHCSSDSSTGSYSSIAATESYMDCMTACDSASSTGCIGFTYVGAANGFGGGQCYLKSGSIGTFTTNGPNLISAVLVGSSSSASSTSSGTVTGPSTVSSTSTPASASLNYCPSADGQVITDTNGLNYTVHCSSDSPVCSYNIASAASSYLDCMIACDSDVANGCTGAVYVGQTNGIGPGICWLKRNIGPYVTTTGNYIAIAQASGLP